MNGADLAHLRWEAEGPPLVLLHGAGARAAVWEPVARELGAFDVVAPSLPGRDGSEGPAHPDAASAAAAVGELLDRLGGPPPIVLGHSYGGAVAIELALRRTAIGGLVLVATGARLRVAPVILEAAARAVEGGDRLQAGLAFLDPSSPARLAYESACDETPPAATLADWMACDAFDRMGSLSGVTAPVLVVSGDRDVLTPPKYQRFLAEAFGRASHSVVEGAGHMLPFEEPTALARILRAWAAATPV